jgi:hypothetical protein
VNDEDLGTLYGEIRALKTRITELEDGFRRMEDALVGKELGWGDPIDPGEQEQEMGEQDNEKTSG